MSKGRAVYGKAHLVKGMQCYLANSAPGDAFLDGRPTAMFVMEISLPVWEELDEKQREALVDHELCHFNVDLDGEELPELVLKLRAHDVEEFTEIIDRHGLWSADLVDFGQAVQLTLDVGKVRRKDRPSAPAKPSRPALHSVPADRGAERFTGPGPDWQPRPEGDR